MNLSKNNKEKNKNNNTKTNTQKTNIRFVASELEKTLHREMVSGIKEPIWKKYNY